MVTIPIAQANGDRQSSLKLSEKVIFLSQPLGDVDGLYKVEIIREGKWLYPKLDSGSFTITKDDLRTFKDNFDNGTKGYILPVNEEHNEKDVIGWLRRVDIAKNNEGSYSCYGFLSVDDPERKERVDNGLLKFNSAEINLGWLDPEDGKQKKVLEGLALTNKPYVKRMDPIEAVEKSVAAVKLSECCAFDDPDCCWLKEDKAVLGLAELKTADPHLAGVPPERRQFVMRSGDTFAPSGWGAMTRGHDGRQVQARGPTDSVGPPSIHPPWTEDNPTALGPWDEAKYAAATHPGIAGHFYGWLSPSANFFHHNAIEGHLSSAPKILQAMGEYDPGSDDAHRDLLNKGWLAVDDGHSWQDAGSFVRAGKDAASYTPEQVEWIEKNLPDHTIGEFSSSEGGNKFANNKKELLSNMRMRGGSHPTQMLQFLAEGAPEAVPGEEMFPGNATTHPYVKAWHADSHPITKDSTGNPRVFYHGTTAGRFDQFKPGTAFFSPDPSVANEYTKQWTQQEGTPFTHQEATGEVYPVHLLMKNPWIEGKSPMLPAGKTGGSEEWHQQLEKAGYDGMVRNTMPQQFVVWHPEQIKSINNSHPTSDPRLMMAEDHNPWTTDELQRASEYAEKIGKPVMGNAYGWLLPSGNVVPNQGMDIHEDTSLGVLGKFHNYQGDSLDENRWASRNDAMRHLGWARIKPGEVEFDSSLHAPTKAQRDYLGGMGDFAWEDSRRKGGGLADYAGGSGVGSLEDHLNGLGKPKVGPVTNMRQFLAEPDYAKAMDDIDMAPSVKWGFEPEWISEKNAAVRSRGFGEHGEPGSVVHKDRSYQAGPLGGKNLPVSEHNVGIYDATGKLAGIFSGLTGGTSSGAWKIAVRPDAQHKGLGMRLLDEAAGAGFDLLGTIDANRFTDEGRGLMRKWIARRAGIKLAEGVSDSSEDEPQRQRVSADSDVVSLYEDRRPAWVRPKTPPIIGNTETAAGPLDFAYTYDQNPAHVHHFVVSRSGQPLGHIAFMHSGQMEPAFGQAGSPSGTEFNAAMPEVIEAEMSPEMRGKGLGDAMHEAFLGQMAKQGHDYVRFANNGIEQYPKEEANVLNRLQERGHDVRSPLLNSGDQPFPDSAPFLVSTRAINNPIGHRSLPDHAPRRTGAYQEMVNRVSHVAIGLDEQKALEDGMVELTGFGVQGAHHPEPSEGFSVEYGNHCAELGEDEDATIYLDPKATLEEDTQPDGTWLENLIRAAMALGVPEEEARAAVQQDPDADSGASLDLMADHLAGMGREGGRKALLSALGYDSAVRGGNAIGLSQGRSWTISDASCLYLAESAPLKAHAKDSGMVPVEAPKKMGNFASVIRPISRHDRSDLIEQGAAPLLNAPALTQSTAIGSARFMRLGDTNPYPARGDFDNDIEVRVRDEDLSPDMRQSLVDYGIAPDEAYPGTGPALKLWSIPKSYYTEHGVENAAKGITKQNFMRWLDSVHRAAARDAPNFAHGYGGEGQAALRQFGLSTDPDAARRMLEAKDPALTTYADVLTAMPPITKRFVDSHDLLNGRYRTIDAITAYLQDKLPDDPGSLRREKIAALEPVPGSLLQKHPWSNDYAQTTADDVRTMWGVVTGERTKAEGGNIPFTAQDDAKRRLMVLANSSPHLIKEAGLTKSKILDTLDVTGPDRSATTFQEAANMDVPDSLHWVGETNLRLLRQNKLQVPDIQQMVKSVRFLPDNFEAPQHNVGELTESAYSKALVNHVAHTIFGFDMNMDYSDLGIAVSPNFDEHVGGLYNPGDTTLYLLREQPHLQTVAHEMSHYIDNKWAREFLDPNTEMLGKDEKVNYLMSEMGDLLRTNQVRDDVSPEKRRWGLAYTQFIEGLADKAESSSAYHQQPSEVFGRFGDYFIRQVAGAAGVDTYDPVNEDFDVRDNFNSQDVQKFIKLLQWKASIDARNA